MRKPNWKRRGLARPVTEKELREAREKRDLDRFLDKTNLPPEVKDFARKHPGLIQ